MKLLSQKSESSIERKLGWLFAIGGCIVFFDQTIFTLSTQENWATWWNSGAWIVITGLLFLALFGLILPDRVLQFLWVSIPVLYITLQFLWVFGITDPAIGAVPWIWSLEPPIVTLLLLSLRPRLVLLSSILISLVPAVASLIFIGVVPETIRLETPIQLGNILYVAIFAGVYHRLKILRVQETEVHRQQREDARTAALLTEHTRISRIIHDEVLSVMAAAIQTKGTPPALLKTAAGQALDALTESIADRTLPEDSHISTLLAAETVLAYLEGVDKNVNFSTTVTSGTLPQKVTDAMMYAAAEALRNSMRHAGAQARRTISIDFSDAQCTICVSDTGCGFDTRATENGLGISQSIIKRMHEIGGFADIESHLGAGTKVILTWNE